MSAVLRLPARPAMDPQRLADLQSLTDRYTAYYADGAEVIEQRQRVLAKVAQDERDQATAERRDWEAAIRAAQADLAADARTAA